MEEDISWIYSLKTIAVVGMSRDKKKPAHYVPLYLKKIGFTLFPVNPSASEILGEKVYSALTDIPEPVDVVLMFRPSENVPDFLEDILSIHPQVLWMQLGIKNSTVKEKAEQQGIQVIMDKCMMQEHERLFGD
ncbi:MAG: CoA-binding protein [Theionarchaea archaeon]|nr:CoA-binding protein [Theionarchaea archaeon]